MLEFVEYIKKNKLGVVYTNKRFKDISTIRIGGEIALLYYPNTLEAFLKFYIYYINNKKCPMIIVGNGSNILASDKLYNGIVISFKRISFKYAIVGNIVKVSSGIMINDLIHYLMNLNLGGLEDLYYIPATIGGMIKMNASAYDSAISDNLISFKTIDSGGNIKYYRKNDVFFRYRETTLNKEEIIIEATFRLFKKRKNEINKKLDYVKQNRIKKYPLNEYNAGSTFKNPNNYKSWFIIDKLGLRGININDAYVSNKHCNFIVNKKNCSSDDMIELIKLIINKAKDEYNISLETEWNLINF